VKKLLKLMPEYECFPIWEGREGENIDPATLPISAGLRKRIEKWDSEYQATYDRNDPIDSNFESPEAEQAFDKTGQQLWRDLQAELGEQYQVTYFSVLTGTLLGSHT